MITKNDEIVVRGQPIAIVRKPIKNLHLAVYPPHGRVRVAVPLALTNDAVRLAVINKLGWIRRHQGRFQSQTRQSPREMTTGESHYFAGQRYRLGIVPNFGPVKVIARRNLKLELHINPDMSSQQRFDVLQLWYRQQLKELIPPLLAKWQKRLRVEVTFWGIKKMKTKWGSCNVKEGRIWLNLELAKKPASCLEYVLVHELTHLKEKHHNGHFIDILDNHFPKWRLVREELNSAPLAHENWKF